MKHISIGFQLVKDTNKKLFDFFPKMRNCSLHTSGLVGNLQCKVRVVIDAGVDILELYNQIKHLIETAKTTLSNVRKCISEERHGPFQTKNAALHVTESKTALQTSETKNALQVMETKNAVQAMQRRYPLHYRRLLKHKK